MSFPLLVQQSKVFSTSTSRAFHGFPMDFKDHPGPWRCWWTPVPWRSPAPSSIYGKIYVGVPPQVECQPAPVKHFREIPEANGDLKMENQCLHHLVWWICSIAMICYMICHDWFSQTVFWCSDQSSVLQLLLFQAPNLRKTMFFWMGTYWNHIVPYFCHRSYNQSAWQCSDGNCIKGDVCKHGMVWGCRLAVLPCLAGVLEVCKVHDIQVWSFFQTANKPCGLSGKSAHTQMQSAVKNRLMTGWSNDTRSLSLGEQNKMFWEP